MDEETLRIEQALEALNDATQNMKALAIQKKAADKPDPDPKEMSAAKSAEKKAKKAVDKLLKEQKAVKDELEDLMKRRFFVVPSFEIYGGVAGLYDFGPPGSALKDQFLDFWRRHFVIYEDMLEITSVCVTPHKVLETSGHVAKFADFMVKDVKEGNCFRADKLLEQHIDKLIESGKCSKEEKERLMIISQNADAYSAEELGQKLKELGIKAPGSGNDLTDPFPFNLMFQTQIGPSGTSPGFLRPETAQSIFVNFKRLLDYNRDRMPFAAAQIGLAFRNEISPRAGLLRVREFLQAEIEHFVNPNDKSHVRFDKIKDNKAYLFSRELQNQKGGKSVLMSFGEAVEKKIIDNQTLAYFLARTQLFLTTCGVSPLKLRFRQHLANEMAHYAADCWDAEIYLRGYKWVEVAGHADRSAYDLKVHSKATKTTLEAQKSLSTPRIENVIEAVPVMKLMGKAFKGDAKIVRAHLVDLDQEGVLALEKELAGGSAKITAGGKEFSLLPQHVDIRKYEKKISTESFIPSVIEPSFGVGRIIYSILDNAISFHGSGKDKRTILRIPAVIAPIKAGIFAVTAKEGLQKTAKQIRQALVEEGLSVQLDLGTTTIGRKYAKADEVGIPYCVSIDDDTKNDGKVTIRDRDSWKQVRVRIEEIPDVIRQLCRLKLSFEACLKKYGEFKL